MARLILTLFLILYSLSAFPQSGQLNIPRIDRMPDLPSPLQIRDWKTVARNYDSLVFDLNKTGPYFPLSRLGIQGQFNYPDNIPLFLDTYVGANGHANQAEAINILPALVGATLAGIDKSNQHGINWIAKSKDFFNRKNGQDVYLNNYFTTSGGDWWYDLMPNVFFYQLYAMYPHAAPEFSSQFTTVADRWLYCVNRLGASSTPWTLPNMNYRAFNLSTGLPLSSSVPEPESAGSIAWLLYHAYQETGNRDYFTGAQQAMDFLTGLIANPSYELQLSYGTIAAAHMNAMEGTDYPLQKMLDWCFNRGDLRGWGSIVGKWSDYDVSGLIGEANDRGDDYAFVMNGFQQAGALAPLPKYDKRYARALAKWILNLSNASRLFYWNALPPANQDSYDWSVANDPAACIPHESMKELFSGQSPYATGDAIRGGWAATNLSLYSGSAVGYLGGIVQSTNVPEILQIDLNKTDFYGDNTLPAFLYYNPLSEARPVEIQLPPGTFDLYDAITESFLLSDVKGTVQVIIPASEVRIIRTFAAGQETRIQNGRLYAGNAVLDYHYGYNYSVSLRIKGISTDRNPIPKNSLFTAYCEPGNNAGQPVKYEWFLDDTPVAGKNQSQAQLTAPGIPSTVVLKCVITANGQSSEDTLHLQIVDRIPVPPVVKGIRSDEPYTVAGQSNTFSALVEQAPDETLEYTWSATSGTLMQETGNPVTWVAPTAPGVGEITVTVTNQDLLSTTVSAEVLVKDTSLAIQAPVIWYPFDSDDRNAAADRYHATATGVSKTEDARGILSKAYRFTSGQDIIYTENHPDLNFTEAVSLSCWVKCEQLGSERFILSHGSWQQRYKLSVTPEGLLRWTVKTSTGVADLDGSAPIDLNRYYHVTALYTGYSMELYVDGLLDTFRTFSGSLLPSTKPFTIGRMDNIETLYALRGGVDEVKVWDREIPVKQIEQLKNQWFEPIIDSTGDPVARLYPNPVRGQIHIEFKGQPDVENIALFASDGRKVIDSSPGSPVAEWSVELPATLSGLHILRIILKDGRISVRKMVIGR